MTVNRRNFLKATLSGAAMAVGSTAIASCTGKPAETSEPAAYRLLVQKLVVSNSIRPHS